MPDLGLWRPLALAFFIVSLALLLWVVLARLLGRTQRSRDISANTALVVFSTAYALLAADLLFGVFFVQSHGFGVALVAKRWAEKYWHPINSYGYRDDEHVWAERVLFVVGDSIAAGAGVERIKDRLSGVLGRKLGPRWTVATLAKSGWDSTAEFAALLAHPKTPDVIVVSYVLNDIEGAAAKRGSTMPQLVTDPPALLKPVVDNSFLANWLYWQFSTGTAADVYWSYQKAAYAAPEIFADHIADLDKFIRHAKTIGAQIYFVIWPILQDLKGSEAIIGKLSDSLHQHGAEAIDLLPYLRQRPLKELIVNPSDAHPNARIHAEMAEVIFERLVRDGLDRLRSGQTQPASSRHATRRHARIVWANLARRVIDGGTATHELALKGGRRSAAQDPPPLAGQCGPRAKYTGYDAIGW